MIKQFLYTCDRRGAFLKLRNFYSGTLKQNQQVAQALHKLANLIYQNENTFSFVNYVSRLVGGNLLNIEGLKGAKNPVTAGTSPL